MVDDTAVVERWIRIRARPETVWKLLTDEHEVLRWMGLRASYDLRLRGPYQVEVVPGQVAMRSFVEIDPPRRLAYTWGWESSDSLPPGTSTVEFDLRADGDGTLLRLRHRDLPDSERRSVH